MGREMERGNKRKRGNREGGMGLGKGTEQEENGM